MIKQRLLRLDRDLGIVVPSALHFKRPQRYVVSLRLHRRRQLRPLDPQIVSEGDNLQSTSTSASESEDVDFLLVLLSSTSAYCIDVVCPHAGASLEEGRLLTADDVDIEDLATGSGPFPSCSAAANTATVADDANDRNDGGTEERDHPSIECPWHAFRFNLKTGRADFDERWTAAVLDVVLDPVDGALALDLTRCRAARDSGTAVDAAEVLKVRKCGSERGRDGEEVEDVGTAETRGGHDGNVEQDAAFEKPSVEGARAGRTWPLCEWAVCVLNEVDPAAKVELALLAFVEWTAGRIPDVGAGAKPPDFPPRSQKLTVQAPGKMKRSSEGGSLQKRLVLLHSLANIELWAIDLAFDIIARFAGTHVVAPSATFATTSNNSHSFASSSSSSTSSSTSSPSSPPTAAANDSTAPVPTGPPLPREFFGDFLKVAADEARHFGYLCDRLAALGSFFGALPVHGALGESAFVSRHSVMDRLAIVHMVHEARGLDVNQGTIAKFERAGDAESVEKLVVIHNDEVTHVATGQKWFRWCCEELGLDRYEAFHEAVRRLFHGTLKPPFNDADRMKAGLDPEYYVPLSTNYQHGGSS
ncbi:hypothetical protein DFJ73DRAFT_590696 [Zopfochytrium polystomum]|nr:hypothetical protein DFJ73DRAFT_590696 [Zopfochytrium polystomum]